MISRLSLILPTTRRLFVSPIIANRVQSKFQTRCYKKFGHKREYEPIITKFFCLFLLTGVVAVFVDWRWCRMLYYYCTGQLKTKDNNITEIENKK